MTISRGQMKRQLYESGGIMSLSKEGIGGGDYRGIDMGSRTGFGILKKVKNLGKKAVKGVKKIAKSDLGKAALAAAAVYYTGGGAIGPFQRAGMSGFKFANLPGASLFTGGKVPFIDSANTELQMLKRAGQLDKGIFSGSITKALTGNVGKIATLGAVTTFLTKTLGMPPEQAEAELARDPSTYLEQYYRNLNPPTADTTSEEYEAQVRDFVVRNTSEYAVGGRVGFADGPVLPPDPTQPVNPFGPKPGDFGIEEDIPIKMASNIENDKILEALFEKYLDMGLSPKDAAKAAQEEFERMSMKKTEGRGLAALGGRMGFDKGTPDPKDLAKMGMGGQKGAVIIGPDGKLKVVTEEELEEMLGGSMSIDKEGIELIERKEEAAGGKMDTASDNAMQAAGIEGLPIRKNKAGVKELDLRKTGGFIQPVGIKEKADDIPAMLSNNEFVFTADAVRGAGGGDVNLGAQRMYDTMKRLEAGGRA